MASLGQRIERFRSRHVHDVQRHVARNFGQHNCAASCFTLQQAWSAVAVVLRVGFAACNVLLHQNVDSNAVFGVHHDGGTVVACLLHCSQDLAVVRIEHAGIRHKQFE